MNSFFASHLEGSVYLSGLNLFVYGPFHCISKAVIIISDNISKIFSTEITLNLPCLLMPTTLAT